MDIYKAILEMEIILILCILGACAGDADTPYPRTDEKGTVRFNFQPLLTSVEEGSLSRSASAIVDTANIKQLWCAVQDAGGRVIRTFHLTGADADRVYLEAMEPGNYTARFMATTEDLPLSTNVPEDLSQPWINDETQGLPFEKDYLYKKQNFTVSPDLAQQSFEVKLPRLTGRVDVRLNLSNPQLEQLIQTVVVQFDETSKVHTFMQGDGIYGGEKGLAPIDVTETRSFRSMPGERLSGTVRITQKLAVGSMETSISEYRFDSLNITPGIISVIRIDYSHNEESYGAITVDASSYTADNSRTMFMNSEPEARILTRRFKVNMPFNVSINSTTQKLVARFYAPVELNDAKFKVWIKFKTYSPKFFLLADYRVIRPFQESEMDIPVMSRACKFTAEDGEQVWIPAQSNLSGNNCELKVTFEANSPYTQKLKDIKCTWDVGFQPNTLNSEVVPMIEPITPFIARHICTLAVNIAYMFSTDHFWTELEKQGNSLYGNDKQPINVQDLKIKLQSRNKIDLGILQVTPYAQGLTLGDKVSMYEEYYPHFYNGDDIYEIQQITFFHELGHWLGYHGHESTMTYDESKGRATVWPSFCRMHFNELSGRSQLPVPMDIVTELPR